MMKPKYIQKVSELKNIYRQRRDIIEKRLCDFTNVPTHEYFYELVYCLLTPQSSAFNAEQVVKALRESDFMNLPISPVPFLLRKNSYIRFHRTKAKRLLELKKNYDYIMANITNGKSNHELRQWLVKNVDGLGWKESSHFLRNIGRKGLAILDRHILKNLFYFNVINSIPKTMTAKRYLSIESRFIQFASDIGIPMDHLDLLFWSMETGEVRK